MSWQNFLGLPAARGTHRPGEVSRKTARPCWFAVVSFKSIAIRFSPGSATLLCVQKTLELLFAPPWMHLLFFYAGIRTKTTFLSCECCHSSAPLMNFSLNVHTEYCCLPAIIRLIYAFTHMVDEQLVYWLSWKFCLSKSDSTLFCVNRFVRTPRQEVRAQGWPKGSAQVVKEMKLSGKAAFTFSGSNWAGLPEL